MSVKNGIVTPYVEGAGNISSERNVQYSRNASIAIGTSNVLVSDTQRRKTFTITNTSTAAADIITINLGFTAAVAGAGIVLPPGSTYGESEDPTFKPWDGSINAICATANGTLSISER